jgi:HD-like signal output (HDOD) protein
MAPLKSFALRSMQGIVTALQPDNPSTLGFEFIRTLAAELSAGKVDIPSFPEVAVRVRRVLADPKSSVEQVMRVVGSEPALAARLLRIANSASLNRSGRVVAELRTAINRLGYNMVRSASIAFAMAQIRKANRLAGLEDHLNDLWQRSTLVAAFAYVLARSCSRVPPDRVPPDRVNPDEALLAGVMHGIGKLYVLTRAAEHPELFVDGTTLEGIIEAWHAPIGRAILENWEFSEEMALAVGEQHGSGRSDPHGEPDLGDVIAIAVLLASHAGDSSSLEQVLQSLPATRRLGLDGPTIERVMRECAAEVAALSDALAG